MILLSLGTHQQPFPRALDLIEPLASAGEDFIVQHGSTPPRPGTPHTTWVEFMSFQAVVDAMARAEYVICHAGVGTIMTALQAGHTPLVIPRRASYNEHVDDHQLDIATRFAEQQLVNCLISDSDISELLVPRLKGPNRQIGVGSQSLRAAVAAAAVAPSHRARR